MTTEVVDPDIAEVVGRLQQRIDTLAPSSGSRRTFLETYLRITAAVGRAVAAGGFEDTVWVRPGLPSPVRGGWPSPPTPRCRR